MQYTHLMQACSAQLTVHNSCRDKHVVHNQGRRQVSKSGGAWMEGSHAQRARNFGVSAREAHVFCFSVKALYSFNLKTFK